MKNISRREFITYGAASIALFGQHGGTCSVEPNVVRGSAAAKSRELVIIHLNGGNDGYNTLVPLSSRAYRKARPNIALAGKDVIRLNDAGRTAIGAGNYGFNSALREVSELYSLGQVAIFPSVGCVSSENSVSSEIFVLNRNVVSNKNDAAHSQGFTKSHERATAIWKTAKPDRISSESWFAELIRPKPSLLATIAETAANTTELTPMITEITIDGFDTHADQLRDHHHALRRFSVTVKELMQKQPDALIFAFSEFGRSFEENDSQGTDHGGASLCFAIGRDVRGGIYGAGEVLDFRQLYATIAANWFQSNIATFDSRTLPTLPFV